MELAGLEARVYQNIRKLLLHLGYKCTFYTNEPTNEAKIPIDRAIR
jgi:hypothetical protein